MVRQIIERGARYGRLVVLEDGASGAHRPILCECECGIRKSIRVDHLKSGRSQSCGCLCRERNSKVHLRHGRAGIAPEYKSWSHIKGRCLNSKDRAFDRYGGRGITVCDHWMDFAAFFEDMGSRPGPGYSIDRIDNNGNYEPGNCRWATAKEQARNKRNNRVLTFNGTAMALSAWAETNGIPYATLQMRLRAGWSIEKTLCNPVRHW